MKRFVTSFVIATRRSRFLMEVNFLNILLMYGEVRYALHARPSALFKHIIKFCCRVTYRCVKELVDFS
jgi:hypothetical protein